MPQGIDENAAITVLSRPQNRLVQTSSRSCLLSSRLIQTMIVPSRRQNVSHNLGLPLEVRVQFIVELQEARLHPTHNRMIPLPLRDGNRVVVLWRVVAVIWPPVGDAELFVFRPSV